MHNLEYGTTPEAEQTRRRFKALLQKKKRLNEDAVGPHSTWLYRFQLLAVLYNLGTLVNNTLIHPSGTAAAISVVGFVTAVLLGWFYLRPRHKLWQLKKQRNELRENNQLVTLSRDSRQMLEDRYAKAGLSHEEGWQLLEDFPDLAVTMAKGQGDLKKARDTGLRIQHIEKIKASLAQSIDNFAIPMAKAKEDQAEAERIMLEIEYNL
jgi:uncharacterized membrane protein YciS (DUF1049 family)